MTKEWRDFIALCERMEVSPADAASCIAAYWERNADLAENNNFPDTAKSSKAHASPFRNFYHLHQKPVTYKFAR